MTAPDGEEARLHDRDVRGEGAAAVTMPAYSSGSDPSRPGDTSRHGCGVPPSGCRFDHERLRLARRAPEDPPRDPLGELVRRDRSLPRLVGDDAGEPDAGVRDRVRGPRDCSRSGLRAVQSSSLSSRRSSARLSRFDASESVTSWSAARSSAASSSVRARATSRRPAASRLVDDRVRLRRSAPPGRRAEAASSRGCGRTRGSARGSSGAQAWRRPSPAAPMPAAPISALPADGAGGV